jgi:hypothetical protein
MKKLLLGAVAFGLMSGAALAEPQKLDDSVLGTVAAGFLVPSSSVWTLTALQNTQNTTTSNLRYASQDLSAGSVNNVYSTGVLATGISAVGSSMAGVTGTINSN